MYCPDCGEEVSDDSRYCRECGADLEAADAGNETPTSTTSTDAGDGYTIPPTVAITAFVMAFVVAFIGWATLFGVWDSWVLFVLVFMGALGYLAQQDYPSEVVGVGLYMTALFVLLFPVTTYWGSITGASNDLAAGVGVVAMFVWLVIAFVIAVIVAGIGYLFNRRASKLAAAS